MVSTIKVCIWILQLLAILELKFIKADFDESSLQDENNGDDSEEIVGAKRFLSELENPVTADDESRHVRSPAYAAWSGWSNCSIQKCTQSRRRNCKMKRKCGHTVQIEEKRCKFARRRGRKRVKCGRKRWKERNKQHIDHSDTMKNVTRNGADSQSRIKYKFQIVSKNKDALERKVLPSKSRKWYSRWSRWSPCTKMCTTYRKRWCKRPKLCARDIIKETAYCYVEGTSCQKWINKKIQSNKNKQNGELFVDTVVEEFHSRDRNDIEESNSVHHTIAHSQCGILFSGKNATSKKNAWSMTRIIGGRQSQKGKWPWQVAVLNKYKEAFCGGTLVSSRWVLTAAHCIRRRLYVTLGEYNLVAKDDMEIEMRIIQMFVHPGYDSETVDNDVALLRLPSMGRQSRNFGVACLPKHRQELPMNKLCTIIGWGKRRSTDVYGTDVLHEAQVPIVVPEVCKNTYIDYYITSNMFCAGYRKGRMDSCAGDSGGPLLCKDPLQPHQPWTIFGITSFGDGCGKRGKYGIYTRLPNYVRWINKVLKMSDDHDR